jgi:hypothetical protein
VTARERRTVRWGAAAAGVILGWVLVVDPWIVRAEGTRALAAERESRLARLQGLQASLPAWRDRLDEARAVWAADVAPRLLPGEVPAVAASFLSEEVRRLAAASYLDVERESVLPSGARDGFVTVPVQFSLRGDVYGLRDFLAALESAVPFLHLRELRVVSAGTGFAPAGAVGAPLQLTITLEGYLAGPDLPGGTAAAPEAAMLDPGADDGFDAAPGADDPGAGGMTAPAGAGPGEPGGGAGMTAPGGSRSRSGAGAPAPRPGAGARRPNGGAAGTPPAGGARPGAAPDVDPDVPGAPPRSAAPDGRVRMEDQQPGVSGAGAIDAGGQEDPGDDPGDPLGDGNDDVVVDPEVE